MSTSNKYKKGEFGYWWTVTKGNEDIDGIDYRGDIKASDKGLYSLRGAPRSVSGDFNHPRRLLQAQKSKYVTKKRFVKPPEL